MLPWVLDAFASHLAARLTGVAVGVEPPALPASLPALVLSLDDCTRLSAGVGGQPRGRATGALPVEAAVDLAAPVLAFPDEVVELLSPDRRQLTLPHSPLVDADGSADGPLTDPADARLRLGATEFTPVAGAPGAGQVRIERASGRCIFGEPLPATGTLVARYHLGDWDVETLHASGRLEVLCLASDSAGVDDLSRRVSAALARGAFTGLGQCDGERWQAIAPAATPANARARLIALRFRVELEAPLVGTGGGPIRTVAVDARLPAGAGQPPTPAASEPFSIPSP